MRDVSFPLWFEEATVHIRKAMVCSILILGGVRIVPDPFRMGAGRRAQARDDDFAGARSDRQTQQRHIDGRRGFHLRVDVFDWHRVGYRKARSFGVLFDHVGKLVRVLNRTETDLHWLRRNPERRK